MALTRLDAAPAMLVRFSWFVSDGYSFLTRFDVPPGVWTATIFRGVAGAKKGDLGSVLLQDVMVCSSNLIGWSDQRTQFSPPPKNVDRLISEYIDRYTKDLFLATNLL